jgi:DNA-binding response OmpR family regulator
MRKHQTTCLEESGYETFTAANGLEGFLEFYQRSPDLVVTDIPMPEMDGLEFCRLARAVSDVPIMILTGLSGSAYKLWRLTLRADSFLVELVEVAESLARVTALLRRRNWDKSLATCSWTSGRES